MQIPQEFRHLARLYWQKRMYRGGSPSLTTLYRRIAAEKKALHEQGFSHIEIHRISRVLVQPNNPRMLSLLQEYVRRREEGVSPWHEPP